MCTVLRAYFKETTGTDPTRQLVWHDRFKGHLISYLCGSQSQEGSAFRLTGHSTASATASCYFLAPETFSVCGHSAHCSPCGSTGTAALEMPAEMVCQTVIGPLTPQTVPDEHFLQEGL